MNNMITTIKFFKMILENNTNIIFKNEHIASHHGQNDYIINAFVDDEIVAFAEYTEFNDVYTISMIESIVKGFGYGKAIMLELARLYGYENLERQSLTPSGAHLRTKVDKELGFNYEEYKQSKNKHLSIEDTINKIKLKYSDVAKFMLDMVTQGSKFTWNKWKNKLNDLDKQLENINLDVNSLYDITEWIKNSKTNENDIEDEPPYFILDYLNRLI